MIKKTVWLSIVFAILFTMFLGSFFALINVHWLVAGLGLYIGIMFRSVSNGPVTIRGRHKKRIGGLIVSLTIVLGIAQNWFMALSFAILMAGIIYTFRDLDYYKNKVVRFNMRSYCMFGGLTMVYFMGFSVAANIIGSNTTLQFNCEEIYKNYEKVSGAIQRISGTTSPSLISYPPTRSERLTSDIKNILKDTPGLQTIYRKVKIYQHDIGTVIVDQQQINREICTLVTNRIHQIYDSSKVQIGLVFLIGLFLYPFFIVLIYLYGLITFVLFRIAVYNGLFKITRRTVEKTGLE